MVDIGDKLADIDPASLDFAPKLVESGPDMAGDAWIQSQVLLDSSGSRWFTTPVTPAQQQAGPRVGISRRADRSADGELLRQSLRPGSDAYFHNAEFRGAVLGRWESSPHRAVSMCAHTWQGAWAGVPSSRFGGRASGRMPLPVAQLRCNLGLVPPRDAKCESNPAASLQPTSAARVGPTHLCRQRWAVHGPVPPVAANVSDRSIVDSVIRGRGRGHIV